jgi:hypothetical protein
MKDIECKEVIITTLERRGKGTENDPIRRVTQVYEKTGEFISENDPIKDKFSIEDMRQFARYCVDQKLSVTDIKSETVIKWDELVF